MVRTVPAEERNLQQTVKALGQCEALVGKLAMLTPVLEGQVQAIVVEHGATVKAGQPIVELDTRLPAADVAEKVAALEAAKASLVLLQSLPRPEEQRISELTTAQASVALQRAQSVLDHLQPLAERNEVSPQQLFDAEKAADQARLQKEFAEAQFHVSMIGPRAEAVKEAKARIAIAEETVKTSQVRLDLHTIRAPIDGVLEDVTCHPGQTIAAGTPIGQIVDSRRLYVLAWLPPRTAQLVRVGQKAEIAATDFTRLAEDASTESPASQSASSGEVVFVGQVADAQTGNLPVRCRIENGDGRLAIGQTVRLTIVVEQERKSLSVPTVAIYDLGEGPLLNVVREGKTVELHPNLGTSHEGWVAVSDTDLKPGDLIIVEGGYNLAEETPVKINGDASAAEPEHAE